MSAYIVSQETAGFIVNAAINYGLINRSEALATANMLMKENQQSVKSRYRDQYAAIPIFTNKKQLGVFNSYHPQQVKWTCEHFAYQSCEHKTWEGSYTYSLIELIKEAAERIPHKKVDEMDLIWGAPIPHLIMGCKWNDIPEKWLSNF